MGMKHKAAWVGACAAIGMSAAGGASAQRGGETGGATRAAVSATADGSGNPAEPAFTLEAAAPPPPATAAVPTSEQSLPPCSATVTDHCRQTVRTRPQ